METSTTYKYYERPLASKHTVLKWCGKVLFTLVTLIIALFVVPSLMSLLY